MEKQGLSLTMECIEGLTHQSYYNNDGMSALQHFLSQNNQTIVKGKS